MMTNKNLGPEITLSIRYGIEYCAKSAVFGMPEYNKWRIDQYVNVLEIKEYRYWFSLQVNNLTERLREKLLQKAKIKSIEEKVGYENA